MIMADLDGNLDYTDKVHTKPHLTNVWSARLVDILNPLVYQGRELPDNFLATADSEPWQLAESPFLCRWWVYPAERRTK